MAVQPAGTLQAWVSGSGRRARQVCVYVCVCVCGGALQGSWLGQVFGNARQRASSCCRPARVLYAQSSMQAVPPLPPARKAVG
jgi:hypothetical protein